VKDSPHAPPRHLLLTAAALGAMIVVVEKEVMRMDQSRRSTPYRTTCHQYPQSEVMTG